eukprot:CAMPEP_0171062966 /NCGR_PEP_ID=MMETSP0766_2-20121228/5358_1 /TAXON_ID=439317 /ORGANISM="Gambierdiscus australes, Strain CAWD 149" /LENGTH=293 /DNA_ID=CAMNT_0011518807 /DNA_START=17 /DNA_END=898 /DNA_ORIENTATION=+
MKQRGRDADGQKRRWSKEEKERAKAMADSKEADLYDAVIKARQRMPAGAPGSALDVSEEEEPQRKKRKKLVKKQKVRQKRLEIVEKSGDILVEHDFDTSEDEEELEVQEAARVKQEEKDKAMERLKHQVYVTKLPRSIDESKIRAHFARCGDLQTVEFERNRKGELNGQATLTFALKEHVFRAIVLDDSSVEAWPLSVKAAAEVQRKLEAKEERRKNRQKPVRKTISPDSEPPAASSGSDFEGGKGQFSEGWKGKGKGKVDRSKGGQSKGASKGKSKGASKGKGKSKSMGKRT